MIESCDRERDVVGLALSRRWPDGADPDLRSHAAGCSICTDALILADLLASDRELLTRDLRVPAAGQVWWRAALRAHTDAAAAARRPLVWLNGIAGACAAALVAALVSLFWPSISDAAGALVELQPDIAPLIEAIRPVVPIALGVLACLLIAPVVVYLALSDD